MHYYYCSSVDYFTVNEPLPLLLTVNEKVDGCTQQIAITLQSISVSESRGSTATVAVRWSVSENGLIVAKAIFCTAPWRQSRNACVNVCQLAHRRIARKAQSARRASQIGQSHVLVANMSARKLLDMRLFRHTSYPVHDKPITFPFSLQVLISYFQL